MLCFNYGEKLTLELKSNLKAWVYDTTHASVLILVLMFILLLHNHCNFKNLGLFHIQRNLQKSTFIALVSLEISGSEEHQQWGMKARRWQSEIIRVSLMTSSLPTQKNLFQKNRNTKWVHDKNTNNMVVPIFKAFDSAKCSIGQKTSTLFLLL